MVITIAAVVHFLLVQVMIGQALDQRGEPARRMLPHRKGEKEAFAAARGVVAINEVSDRIVEWGRAETAHEARTATQERGMSHVKVEDNLTLRPPILRLKIIAVNVSSLVVRER